MQTLSRVAAAIIMAALLSACGAGSSLSGSPGSAGAAVPNVTASGHPLTLASATNSVCVKAQNTAQTVVLPATGGVTATLDFAAYDVGGSGCQNVTIATGSAAAAQQLVMQSAGTSIRNVQTTGAPILTITMGEGFSSTLGVATAVSGARFQTDSNVNFPDGTYNALVTWSILGAPVTLSLQFTASGGVLTVVNANAFPFRVPGGARIALYDRGVVPAGFTLSTPTATPNPSATPAVTPTPIFSSIPGAFGSPPPPTIGHATYTLAMDCPGGFYPGGGPLCSDTVPLIINGGGNYRLPLLPGDGAGTISYTVDSFQALSYSLEGCAFPIQYSGGGLQGTFTIPDRSAFPNGRFGTCYLHLLTTPAGVNGNGYEATPELYAGNDTSFPTTFFPVTPLTPAPAHT